MRKLRRLLPRRVRQDGKAYLAMLQTWLRWQYRPSPRPHGLPGALVVSLTSYPPRFGSLVHTLRSLLSQSVAPDRVILWVGHGDEQRLPKQVLGLREHGLSIMSTDDIGPFTKIIPTIERHGDAFIATADDDVFYPPTWLEALASAWTGDNREIVFHRGHTIRLDEKGLPRPYVRWRYERIESKISTLSFPTGVGGILYPPGSLHAEVVDEETFTNLCPNADDVWLYWMGRRAGSRYRHVGSMSSLITWPGSQRVSLFSRNCAGDENDLQIARMVKRFGFPSKAHE